MFELPPLAERFMYSAFVLSVVGYTASSAGLNYDYNCWINRFCRALLPVVYFLVLRSVIDLETVSIKFRGKRDDGSYVYGYYVPWALCSKYQRAGTVRQCQVCGEVWKPKVGILDDTGDTVIVDADTVVQLIGYDVAGNELYESDEILNGKKNNPPRKKRTR